MYQFLKRIAAVVLCVMLLVSSAMADVMSTNDYTHKAIELIKAEDATKSDKLDIHFITPVPGGADNPSMQNSVETIHNGLESAKANAEKYVDVVDEENGIVKIDVDVVYKPETVSVAFVLDRSGSMNMWVDKIDAEASYMEYNDPSRNLHVSTSTVPCMNPEHYYEINYIIEGDSEKHIYNFYPVQADGSVKNWLSALDNKKRVDSADDSFIEIEIEKQYQNKEVMITSIGRHMDSNGTRNDSTDDKHIDPLLPNSSGINPNYINKDFGYDNNFGFSSPNADLAEDYYDTNGNRCFDRSMLARHMIWQFVEKLHQANPDNQVAFTTFAATSETDYRQGFVTAKNTEEKNKLKHVILDDRGGAQFTNYAAGLTSAAELFNISLDGTASQNAVTGKKIIVFVSDGSPSPLQMEGEDWDLAVDRADGSQEATGLKNRPNNVEIYAVGVNVGDYAKNKYLLPLASDKDHVDDCKTTQQFISFLNRIMDNVIEKKSVTLEDTIGEDFDLYVTTDYPITLTDGNGSTPVTIKNEKELEDSEVIKYEDGQISTTVDAHEKGHRLSFYAKLKSPIPDESGLKESTINEELKYQYKNSEDQNVTDEQHPTDKLIVGRTILTAVKDNGNMKDKTVHPGDSIPYTITVKNENGFDLTGLVVTDIIPEGTEYVENSATDGADYDKAEKKLTFTAETIAANGEVSFKFNVKVLPGFNNIVNRATFTVNEAVDPATSTKLIAQTNEVVNPRGDVPQVKAVKSNGEMEGKAVKPGDVIPYTITLTNENEFALTNVKVTDVIPEGTEYVEDSAKASGGTYDAQNKQVTFEAASIGAGESISFTFKVKVHVGMNTIVNQASYSVAEIVEEDPENPDTLIPKTFETNKVENPRGDVKLSAVKSNGEMEGKTVKPGDVIPYTIKLTNNNNVALTNVKVTDVIPEGTEYVQGSGGTYNAEKNQVEFTADKVEATDSIIFTFKVKVLVGMNTIVNKASYSAAEIVKEDPKNPGTLIPKTFETNKVENPRGDVEISAVKSNGSMADKTVKPGDVIPYTITLTNNNNVALTDVLVVDPIPEGTEYVKGSGGTYKPDNNLVVFTAESIAPNSNITFTFYVKVLEGTNVIVNKAYYSVAEIVVPNSDPDYPNEFVRVTFETNEVDNPRMVFTEEIPNVPQTGDNASPLVWALLAMLSLACITMLMNRKKA
ncbi:MAG: DUF11 domain-containing protein [Clostridia bacterium]|nr:DUF11 domain-containing protein [Clostridia bacterium]